MPYILAANKRVAKLNFITLCLFKTRGGKSILVRHSSRSIDTCVKKRLW